MMIMKLITEINGYKLGINDAPDVVAGIPEEDKRYMLIEPDGEEFVGGKKGIVRLFNKLTNSNLSES